MSGPFVGDQLIRVAQYQATTAANTYPTAATLNYGFAATADFSALRAASGLALTAAGCKVTYTGPTRAFRLAFRAACAHAGAINGFVFAALDLNGDRVGVDCTTLFAETIDQTLIQAQDFPAVVGTERIVTLSTGNVVAPVLGCLTDTGTPIGVSLAIDRLIFTIQDLGAILP